VVKLQQKSQPNASAFLAAQFIGTKTRAALFDLSVTQTLLTLSKANGLIDVQECQAIGSLSDAAIA